METHRSCGNGTPFEIRNCLQKISREIQVRRIRFKINGKKTFGNLYKNLLQSLESLLSGTLVQNIFSPSLWKCYWDSFLIVFILSYINLFPEQLSVLCLHK